MEIASEPRQREGAIHHAPGAGPVTTTRRRREAAGQGRVTLSGSSGLALTASCCLGARRGPVSVLDGSGVASGSTARCPPQPPTHTRTATQTGICSKVLGQVWGSSPVKLTSPKKTSATPIPLDPGSQASTIALRRSSTEGSSMPWGRPKRRTRITLAPASSALLGSVQPGCLCRRIDAQGFVSRALCPSSPNSSADLGWRRRVRSLRPAPHPTTERRWRRDRARRDGLRRPASPPRPHPLYPPP